MKGILNIILFSLNLLFISRGQSEIPVCSNQQINNNVGEGGGSCIDKQACTGYVTGTSCETQCADSESATSITANGKTYFQCNACSKAHVSSSQLLCLDACDSEISQSEKKRCQAFSSCKTFVSFDKSACLEKCPFGQFSQTIGTGDAAYKLCTQCSGATPLYQSLNDVVSCVKECDSSLILFTADNTCQDVSACTLYLSSDKKKCTSSCDNDYVLMTENKAYKVCSATCYSPLYKYTDKSVKSCNNYCPGKFIIKESTKTCLENYKDCDLFISSMFNSCTDTCEQMMRETPVQQSGYKVCHRCEDFYIPATDTTKASCVKTCPDGYIGKINDGSCYLFSTASTLGCKGLKISSDKKTCDLNCPLSDILINGVCVAPCNTPGCNSCPEDGQILNLESVLSCISFGTCAQSLSSDGTKCVSSCQLIDEVGEKTCQKCPTDKVFYMTELGKSDCKAADELTNEDRLQVLTRQLKIALLNTQSQVEAFTNKLTEKTKMLGQQLTSTSNVKDTLTLLEGDLKLLQKALPYGQMTNMVKVGSSSTIMSYIQQMKTSRKVITSLDLKSLLAGSPTDLTELAEPMYSETGLRVLISIVASNPACKTNDCKKFPIVQAQVLEDTGRRMLTFSKTLTVDFTVTEPSSKYICLNYNLQTSEVTGAYTVPITSNNGLTITCDMNGATQIFLDSSCMYLDKSQCATTSSEPSPASNDDGSSGISTGAIIGIIIGAAAGTILFSVGGYFLYKKFVKTRSINYEVKQPQPVPTTEV